MNPEFTQILHELKEGKLDPHQLLPVVYGELRHMAQERMLGEAPGHTLQATALVHEAWLRLSGKGGESGWENRAHFFGAASEAMRRILVDHARKKLSQKRGGKAPHTELNEVEILVETPAEELLAVHEALEVLEREDAKSAQLVKLRYFVGMTMEEAATALDLKKRSAEALWTYARLRLKQLMNAKD